MGFARQVQGEQYEQYKAVYNEFLRILCRNDEQALESLAEQRLYNEINDYLKNPIQLHDIKLSVLNEESDDIQIFETKSYFSFGQYIEREKNEQQQIIPLKLSKNIPFDSLQMYISMFPMKFTDMPFLIVHEMVFKTKTKLQMQFHGENLIGKDEIDKYEYHSVRFEGMIQMYTNKISDIIDMRNIYRQCKEVLSQNLVLENVESWQMTDLDKTINDRTIQ